MHSAMLAILLTGAVCSEAPKGSDAKSLWIGDYQEARKIARKENKPIFLVFR